MLTLPRLTDEAQSSLGTASRLAIRFTKEERLQIRNHARFVDAFGVLDRVELSRHIRACQKQAVGTLLSDSLLKIVRLIWDGHPNLYVDSHCEIDLDGDSAILRMDDNYPISLPETIPLAGPDRRLARLFSGFLQSLPFDPMRPADLYSQRYWIQEDMEALHEWLPSVFRYPQGLAIEQMARIIYIVARKNSLPVMENWEDTQDADNRMHMAAEYLGWINDRELIAFLEYQEKRASMEWLNDMSDLLPQCNKESRIYWLPIIDEFKALVSDQNFDAVFDIIRSVMDAQDDAIPHLGMDIFVVSDTEHGWRMAEEAGDYFMQTGEDGALILDAAPENVPLIKLMGFLLNLQYSGWHHLVRWLYR